MSREMKDSGVQWIGEIPKEWEIRKMDSIADKITDYVASGSFASLNENVKYLDEPDYAMLVRTVDLSDKSSHKRVYINKSAYDFLANSNLFGGELILSNIGSVGNVFIYKPLYSHATLAPNSILVRMKDNTNYFYYWFINPYGNESLKNIGSNAVQLKFNKTQLRQLLVPRPPLKEQNKIANYLDKKVFQIDDIISKQKSLIEKYKAYKQSLITETVTKGLDKNVPMKDSGIEWIGEIPSHWNICRMKNIGEAIIGLTYSPEEVSDSGTLVLRSSNVKNGKIVYEDNVFVNKNIPKKLITRIGDILICSRNGSRALIGKCAYIDELSAEKSFGAFMTIFRSEYNKFIYYILNSAIFKFHIGTFLTSTINQLTTSNLNGISITLPPKEEQEEIANFLDKKCNEIDSTISKKEQLISKLEDYKKSLIYECVTGKREVL